MSPSALLLIFSCWSLAEKERLLQDHRKALDAQDLYSRGLKDQLIQAELKHSEAMKAAQAAAEAKLNEALEDANNSTVVLRAELEEGAKARKAAEDEAARLKAEQEEYDLFVMQTDSLARRKFFFSLPVLLTSSSFPVTCTYLCFVHCRPLSGFPGLRPEKGSGSPGCTSLQGSGRSLGRLRSPGSP